MQTTIHCFPCFLRQVVIAIEQGSTDPSRDFHEVIKRVLPIIQNTDMSRPPAYTTTSIHREIRECLGIDPFESIKRGYNAIAMDLVPSLKNFLDASEDRLQTATRLAIAGNVIDFGIYSSVNIEDSIKRALQKSISVDDYTLFRNALNTSDNLLYILDNAGEIVFDKVLIEELTALGKRVTAVVRGHPVINDATIADAQQIFLENVCEVIDNGSDGIGTILDWTSEDFQSRFNKAELIISKGQANFETLVGIEKKIFFLFQAKCDVVSRELGLEQGAMLLMSGEKITSDV